MFSRIAIPWPAASTEAAGQFIYTRKSSVAVLTNRSESNIMVILYEIFDLRLGDDDRDDPLRRANACCCPVLRTRPGGTLFSRNRCRGLPVRLGARRPRARWFTSRHLCRAG